MLLLLRWPGIEIFYSNNSFLHVKASSSLYFLHIDPVWLRAHYMILIYACIVLLILNILGIGRNLVSLGVFLGFTLLNDLDDRITNGGDVMSTLLLLYLSFANSFSYFTLFKRKPLREPAEKLYNLLSNLAAWCIIINLCFAYFFSGFFKVLNPYWQNGTALHYFLNDERYSVFAAGGKYVEFPAFFLYIINYGTLLLELCFPVLVFYKKKYRNPILFTCFLMHLGIYSFLMVYTMSMIFVLQYGMFYSNEELLSLVEKIKAKFRRVFSFAVK